MLSSLCSPCFLGSALRGTALHARHFQPEQCRGTTNGSCWTGTIKPEELSLLRITASLNKPKMHIGLIKANPMLFQAVVWVYLSPATEKLGIEYRVFKVFQYFVEVMKLEGWRFVKSREMSTW